MKSSTMIIAFLALVLLIGGCTQSSKKIPVSGNTNAAGTANSAGTTADTGNVVAPDASADLGQGVAVDNPTDPGTLDDIPVSDSIPP